MKKTIIALLIFTSLSLVSCGSENSSSASEASKAESSVSETASSEEAEISAPEEETSSAEETTEHATAPQNEVGYEGMTEVPASSLNDGEYHINVDSSSSMFKIADCILHVENGEMTADLIIDSKSYDLLFMGTEGEAASAAEADCISYSENESGQSVFTVPVEALDQEILCAALSAKKQEWYGRTLVFRADSLPDEAFSVSRYLTVSDLGLEDGEYTVDVELEGGSGKASVQSPAKLTVTGGEAYAEIIWSSNKYDYMIVGGEKILPTDTEEFSVFDIPVSGFDYDMKVSADTTAMSTPHEIEYTLYFDSSSVS